MMMMMMKNAVNDLYDVLHFDRSFSLDIWRNKRYVCFWPWWFSKSAISSTVITFSSVRFGYASVWRSCAFGRFRMFLKLVLITFPFFPVAVYLQKFCPYSPKTVFLNRYKFRIRALSPLLNRTLHNRYIVGALKIIIYDNIICFCLQTLEMYVKLTII